MLPIHRRLAIKSRRGKADEVVSLILEREIKTVLVVGASAGKDVNGYGNLIEQSISAVCAGTVFSGLEKTSDSEDKWIQADGRSLPFADNEFDLVFSNAVIEHVGDAADQADFVQEHQRVGRNWYLTTPNRTFPFETHTGVPFRHMTGHWTPQSVSRLLTERLLRELTGPGVKVTRGYLRATLSAFNL